ncbi:MAG TPA: phosphoribosylformylglycinamidine synthase subunit PurL [Thermoplasmata archaeon]|nr:phosphoribosylformylglycinamidine synthase subunit PurL [Thermoplasmata archaeon]
MAADGAPPPEWAPEVHVVELRGRSARARSALSERLGLGLSNEELARVDRWYRAARRDPTDVELAGIAQSWSEHCSYKSSKSWLRRAFRGLASDRRVLGTGDAGVMRFDRTLAYALRIESHNHPSAVEPYGGAATGIGGILRDVLAVGAKPIALADPLFFGPLSQGPQDVPAGIHAPGYLYHGVVAGIRDYGNRVGVPTVTGSVSFDPAYTVNPLVNVGCLGLLEARRLRPNRAQAAGDHLVLVGGLTGRDGVGGVAFASRVLTQSSGEASRSHVQLGNPIMKEPLIHACLEAYRAGWVRGVKDLGGGGLATAAGELAHAGGFGLSLHLDRVPLREADLAPWEIWISESQERMLLEVPPAFVENVVALFARYEVPATDVGSIRSGDREELLYRGRPAGALSLSFRVEPILLERPRRRRRVRGASSGSLSPGEDLARLFEQAVLSPETSSREPIVRVYDHEVQGRTVVKPLHGRPESPSAGDASVLRPNPDRPRSIAITVASQPWSCAASPRHGAVWTVEEAARNLYAVGARPDALTDCLNFGRPDDPRVMDDFIEVLGGLASAARAIGFAVPSGNVSFYNGGLGSEIPPTPVLMATGIVEDFRRAVTSDLKAPGNPLYLLGRSSPHLGGSLLARQRKVRGLPLPPVSPTRVRRMGEALLRAGARGAVRSAHDISDGGLAVTLFEMAAGGGLGFEVDLARTGLEAPGVALVAEGASRWVVEVPEGETARAERLFGSLPFVRIGRVTPSGGRLLLDGRPKADLDLGTLYERWRAGPEGPTSEP